ncbi:TlpA family protein disulfide reductase [Campylobacter sp. RM9344]|uniref:TlpA family protein disulfide reductase n=1 Tax=Campylobacter californiensis TaxID=1032243 RepID=A0AAW3ZTA5_9BACT|nr:MULTISPECIES: TlpA family protein disulfide reductase [unclassified Campylobacter]MBE2983954.1 TlpA family protein disulfide reductase [Campylobacter sp. RM6883]MBE2986116.1 TlpA family protein disulfide reductase [Campylobacter sp. RM12919]MBE2987529.1 TlpA family protein disulfide reductase [Campylobacter sp. RM12920]MBE2994492.1 TlpA family protein disulfide reductase [Campylobacter sp. RM6913]MBE3028800.1 TlpA family protein disulfide reductase [Campylobacter sp. RM9344]
MKKILTVLLSMFLFLGCSSEEKETSVLNFKEYAKGEEIKLTSVSGKELTLVRTQNGFNIKGDENKIIMFDIFGTFCPPCQKEAPNLMEYQLKNVENFILIGLTYFENVTDEYVQKEFIEKYNGYYFIANNQKINERLVEQITRDIDYKREISLPFKVVTKDGAYQLLTDVDSGNFGVKYYLGGIKIDKMKSDIERIQSAK